MFWFSHRGLSPHLQRAHAGRTRGDGPNHHAFGTFVTHPADAGSAPKASGDPSSRTFARNIDLPAYGTRHPSATILTTELCARFTRFRNPDACRQNTMSQGATARQPREHAFAGDRWHGFRDRNDICHSRLTEANRAMMPDVSIQRSRAAEPQKLRFHAILDHDRDSANRAMHRITMPSALLSQRLLTHPLRQKQVVIGDGGR